MSGLPAERGTENPPPSEVRGHLKTLILEGCSVMSDRGISLLSQHSVPVLEVVNISDCRQLTGAAVSSLATVRAVCILSHASPYIMLMFTAILHVLSCLYMV